MWPVVVLYAKPPLPGRCKSRLSAEIGAEAAAGLAAAMLADNLTMLATCPDCEPQLWHPAGIAADAFQPWLPLGLANLRHHVQQGADLGERMGHTIQSQLRRGAPGCIIIGADCVTHTPEMIAAAVALLSTYDVVLRPAADGGFVLIGARVFPDGVIDGMAWGHERVLDQVRERLTAAGLTLALLPSTADVDTAADLATAKNQCRPGGAVADWFAVSETSAARRF